MAQIKASGADSVITGNWGTDITLLIKAADSAGLEIPFLTYYSNSPGAPTAMGQSGVGRVYLVWGWSTDFNDPTIYKHAVQMKKEAGYNYGVIREIYMLHMLKKAAEKANSIDPVDVAYALEGLHYKGPAGMAFMRAKDHQIEMPMYVSVFTDGMKYSLGKTDHLGFHTIAKFSAKQGELPTSCNMQRPERPDQ